MIAYEKMKPAFQLRIFLILILSLPIIFNSCRAKRVSEPEPAFEIEESMPEQEIVVPAPIPAPSPPPVAAPVRTVEERFTFTREEDQRVHQVHRYFVIIGSFRVERNAQNFMTQLVRKGFTPVILLSETGMHRVSVDSFNDENQAHQRVLQIRRNFPEHHDTWLLRRR